MEVPIRELKNNLSKYVRLVKEGQLVIVTDRKKPVAQIAELPASSRGALPGGIDWRKGKPKGTSVRLRDARLKASDVVLEERR